MRSSPKVAEWIGQVRLGRAKTVSSLIFGGRPHSVVATQPSLSRRLRFCCRLHCRMAAVRHLGSRGARPRERPCAPCVDVLPSVSSLTVPAPITVHLDSPSVDEWKPVVSKTVKRSTRLRLRAAPASFSASSAFSPAAVVASTISSRLEPSSSPVPAPEVASNIPPLQSHQPAFPINNVLHVELRRSRHCSPHPHWKTLRQRFRERPFR